MTLGPSEKAGWRLWHGPHCWSLHFSIRSKGCGLVGDYNGVQYTTLSAWWLTYPSEKYEFVSWDDDIPNIWKVIKVMFQTTNQLYTVANMGLIPSIIWVVSTSFKPSPKKKPSAWRSRGTSWNSISPDGDRLRLLVPWQKKLIIPMLLAWQICGLKLLKIGSCHSSTY